MSILRKLDIVFMGIILILSFGCNSPNRIVERFYNGLNNSDFKEVKKCSTKEIKILRQGILVAKDRSEMYKGFQYDSVCQPRYKIMNIKSTDGLVNVTLSKIDERIAFLHDTALIYNVVVTMKNHRIDKIEVKDYILLDLAKLQSRKDSLVTWIGENHPELKGFELDQTVKGAQSYLTAIELYNVENSKK